MKRISTAFFTLTVLLASSAYAQDGEKLFKQNCASCHTLTDKAMVGPGLAGLFDRIPSEEWAISWVKNSSKMVAAGDPYAVKIFNANNKVPMSAFEFLSDEEIKGVLSYIRNPPVKEVPAAAAVVADAGAKPSGALAGDTLIYVLVGLALLLLLLLVVLRGVKRSLTHLVSERDGVPAPVEKGAVGTLLSWMNTHRGWTAFSVLVVVLILLRMGIQGLMTIGVYQGYAPTQPINFSHKIHAGQNGINCVYCHSSAEKGKTAGIPSLNVCMNCHSYVDQGPTGTAEIAKIYRALDYDPATKTYGSKPTPVKWVRVHNLPDLSYFNHSQHVVAGQIPCQTCHGAVEEQAVVGQHSPLTMGWCIDCHRTTNVQVTDNGYYEDLHKRTPEWHNGDPITVERIGGLECAKCHY
ncbi:MAG: c-type cytochrome [Flavobacteriales bacterium]|nr:c-type cytochrome [Flavobacteriales bacterium]